MKSLARITGFFIAAPGILLVSGMLLAGSVNIDAKSPLVSSAFPGEVLSAFSENPDNSFFATTFGSLITMDAREHIIKEYLRKYSSPLEPFTKTLVETSDKYSLDYRLLVAIAQQESNLCKRIPPDSHNCWGFGIYGDKVTRFDNYPQAIETVAKTLKRKYIDQGLKTPEEIMAKYTPPSVEIGGPWAKGVNLFMSNLE